MTDTHSRPETRTHPPLEIDPELEPILAMVQQAIPAVGLTPAAIDQLRAAFSLRESDADLAREGRFTIEDHLAPGKGDSPSVPVLLCRPTQVEGPLPVLFYAHGGGMVAGHNRSNIGELLDLAEQTSAAVASVEYRLAPEHPLPAALDDCVAALGWIRAYATEFSLDPRRIVLAGTSAGGGLVATLAQRERDAASGALAGQLLMAPMLDDRNVSVSARQMEGLGVWDRVSNETGWASALGGSAGEQPPAYAAAARAADFADLPPAFLDVGEAETFRDEVVDYASSLWHAGVSTELHVWKGAFHGFDGMVPDAAVSRDAKAARLAWLRRCL